MVENAFGVSVPLAARALRYVYSTTQLFAFYYNVEHTYDFKCTVIAEMGFLFDVSHVDNSFHFVAIFF